MESSNDLPTQPGGLPPFIAYQTDWLLDRSRFKGMVKSRRVGGSYVIAADAAGSAAGFDWARGVYEPDKGEDEFLISASQYQSELLLRQAFQHLERIGQVLTKYNALAEIAIEEGVAPSPFVLWEMAGALEGASEADGHGGSPGLKKLGKALQKTSGFGNLISDVRSDQIKLKNGHTVSARPANPNTVRGAGGNLVFDEMGSMPQSHDIWAAAAPIANKSLGAKEGFSLSVIGTPWGDDNMFYQLACTKEGAAFSWHWVDIYRAIHDGFNEDPEELRRIAGDEDTYLQEYCCAFLSAASRYIPESMLDPPCSYDPKDPEILKLMEETTEPSAFGGHDVANSQKGDLSATVIVWKIGDIFWVRPEIWAERGASFTRQKDRIGELFDSELNENGVRRLCLDKTGLGSNMAEDLKRKYGARIEPVNFDNAIKEDMATRLKRLLDEKRLRIPTSEPQLRRDILAMRRLITTHGAIRFDIEGSRKHGHGDRAWALMLALLAADKPTPPPAGKQWRKPALARMVRQRSPLLQSNPYQVHRIALLARLAAKWPAMYRVMPPAALRASCMRSGAWARPSSSPLYLPA